MQFTGLLNKDSHYLDIELYYHALNSLPENDVPNEILFIEMNDTTIDDNTTSSRDFGPVANEDDIVCDSYKYSFSVTFLPEIRPINKKLISFIRIFLK